MNDEITDNDVDNDPERTLITLDQLSQTIEVMTSVVNRLRRHLSEQIKAKMLEEAESEAQAELHELKTADATGNKSESGAKANPNNGNAHQATPKRESFVVEISQHELDSPRKNNKVLH